MNAGYQEKEFGAYDFYTPHMGFASREWTKTFLAQGNAEFETENAVLKPQFSWRRHLDKFMLDKTGQRSLYLNHHRTDTYAPGIFLSLEPAFPDVLTTGVEFTEERIRSTNLGNHARNRESFYLGAEQMLGQRVSLEAGARLDDCAEPSDYLAYKLNASLKISDTLSVRAGTSSRARVPSFTELYYSDPTTLSNPLLAPENSRDYEAGCDYKAADRSCGITFFTRSENDFIDWVKQSSDQASWKAENITRARTAGLEAYARRSIGGAAEIEASYEYSDRRLKDRGYLYKYGMNYARHRFAGILYLRALRGVQAVGLTYTKKPARDGWVVMNARFEYPVNSRVFVFLTLENIFNTEYQEIEGIPQPARSAECGVKLRW